MSFENIKTILLVEDEVITSIMNKKTLQKFGYNVVTAESGEKAIETVINNKNIDLILIDIDLGEGIDGTEAAAIILKDNDIPVVFLSSHTEPEVVEKTEKITSYGYVVKNSGATVLDASIKMAFKLFDANVKLRNEFSIRKLAEDGLYQAKITWENTFNSISDIVCMISNEHTFLEINEVGIKSLNLPKEKIIGRKCFELVHGTNAPIEQCPCNKAIQSGKEEFYEYEQDGKHYILHARPVYNDSGVFTSFVHTIKDITEHKQVKLKLQLSEDRITKSLDNLIEGCQILDFNWRFLYLNDSAAKQGRKSKEEFLGKKITDVLPGIENTEMFSVLKQAMENRQAQHMENEFTYFDGKKGWFELSIQPTDEGIFILSIDITGQKRIQEVLQSSEAALVQTNEELEQTIEELNASNEEMETISEELIKTNKALQESEYFFKESQKAAHIGSYQTDFISGFWKSSKVLDEIFGIDQNYERSVQGWLDIVHPDDRNMMNNYLTEEVIKERIQFNKEYRIIRKSDNEVKWVLGLGKVDFNNDGNIISMIGTIQDITGRRLLEEKKLEDELKYNQLFELATDPFFLVSAETAQILDVNEMALDKYGYNKNEFLSMKITEISNEPEETLKVVFDSADTFNKSMKIFFRNHRKKDGTVFPVEVTIRSFILNGHKVHFSACHDITERKLMEESILASEEILRKTLESAPFPIMIHTEDGNVEMINKSWIELTGYAHSDIQTIDDWTEKAYGERHEIVKNYIDSLYNLDGRKDEGEYTIKTANGNNIVWDFSSAALGKLPDGRRAIISMAKDITEKKKTEDALRESEWRYRYLFEKAPFGIGIANLNGKIIEANETMQKILGYTWEELKNINILELYVKPEDRQILLEKLRESGYVSDFTVLLRRKDGRECWFYLAIDLKNINGIDVIQTVAQDITEQRQKEEKISALLAEKEIILKEVNHRIKNNMNTIYGLLILKSETLKDISLKSILEDSANRVKSMMVLYDKLYRSSDVQKISVRDYLPSLVDEIITIFPNSSMVKVEKEIDDFVLEAKKLQSLGLIINELLSNIMKYAFTGKDEGEIRVTASLSGTQTSVIIEDNGNGIPETVDFENSTGFGLQLVWMMTKELKGDIRIERENGTRVILEFEI